MQSNNRSGNQNLVEQGFGALDDYIESQKATFVTALPGKSEHIASIIVDDPQRVGFDALERLIKEQRQMALLSTKA